VDWELIQPIGFILLGSAGIVCAVLGTWFVLIERRESNGVLVALALFVVQYALAYGVAFSLQIRLEPLLRTILMFLVAIALVLAIRIGYRSDSKGGSRIALASAFTLGAYICLVARFLPKH
jgi:hypothetical protein